MGLSFFLLMAPFVDGMRIAHASDSFVTSSIAEPSNLLPLFASDSASAEISRLVFNGLVKYDKNLKLIGDLADRWEISADGLKIIFYLKQNVRWQDGKLFTAEDVLFTFGKMTDPSVPTPYGADFEKVSSVKATDAYTVEVIYKEPFSPGLASWGMGVLPKHLLEKENLLTTSFARHPVGTGPYRLTLWKAGERLELEANADYFEGRPGLSRYVYRVIPDTSTNFLELQTEGLDLSALTPLQFSRQTDGAFFKKYYHKFRYPSPSYTYIGYNLTNPLFSDRRVRKALGLAIQKKEIVSATLMGLGSVATGPFLPGSWAYDRSVTPTPFDPKQSKELLAQAGWRDSNGDGILDKEGRPFSFTLLTNQGNTERQMACEIIQKNLKDVGIQVKIQVVEWGTFLKEFIDKKRFDAVLLAWQLSRDPDIYDIFHSARIDGGFNFISYKNAEVDRLLEEGRRVFSEAERAEIYHKLHRILSEEEPYTFLYVPEALVAVHGRFQGVEMAPAGLGHNFIRWSVDPGKERWKV